jgi:hypothetical protein
MPDDPLYRNVQLGIRASIPVLGVPVNFASNDAGVMATVEEDYGMWRVLEQHPDLVSDVVISIRLTVHEGNERSDGRAPISYRMPDAERVIVHTPGSLGIADVRRGEAIAYVTPSLAADREHFRYGVLDTLTLTLVTTRDRLPIHAALVRQGARALILAGPSGVGKSSLAYTAKSAGWELLTDDACYVQMDPDLRLWGIPGRTYLPPDTAARFPALRERTPERLANGKLKIPIDLEPPAPTGGPPVVRDVAICLLARDGGPMALDRATPEEVSRGLGDELDLTHDLYVDTKQSVLERLTGNGGWRLTLSEDPREALQYLDRIVAG